MDLHLNLLVDIANPDFDLAPLEQWPFVEGPSSSLAPAVLEALTSRVTAGAGYVSRPALAALSRLLEAGHDLPVALQASLMAAGKLDLLDDWSARFPGRLLPLGELAGQVVLPRGPFLVSPLHALVENPGDNDELLERVLSAGADPNVANSEGYPPLASVTRLHLVQRLVAAGADPMARVDGRSVLSRAWSHQRDEANPQRVAQWVDLLNAHASPAQRPDVLFDLAAGGPGPLLDALMGVWGVKPEHLDTLTTHRPLAAGRSVRTLSWPGWLAFHALSGLSHLPVRLLGESIGRLQGREKDLPEFDRMWLSVLNHAADPHSNLRGQSLSFKYGSDYRACPAQPGDVGAWALAQDDLPWNEGGITRSHPFRGWVVAQLESQLASAQPCAGTWKVASRLMVEEADGNQRMPPKLYTLVREAVLKHALKNQPGEDVDSVPAVLLAMASSLEQASLLTNPSLPSVDNGGGIHLAGDFQAWIQADWNVSQWESAVEASLKALPERIRPDQIRQRYGAPPTNDPSNWLGTWALLGTRLRARFLEENWADKPVAPSRGRPRM